MSFIGIHASLIYIIKKIFPKSKFIVPILIGLLIPDVENYLILILRLDNISFILHNIFSIILIYLLIKILQEISKSNSYKMIASGVFIGMLIHIAIDSMIGGEPIIFFWPISEISITINAHSYAGIFNSKYIYIMNFFMFRFLGWVLIEELLLLDNASNSKSKQIQDLSFFIKLQLYCILIASINTIIPLYFSYYLSIFNFMMFSYSFFYMLNYCIKFYKNF